MKEIGRILQEQREAKGLSLKEVQAATKIRQRYLEALEAGEPSVLPAEVYVRGFLRSYAEYLGLDARELLSQYTGEAAKPASEEEGGRERASGEFRPAPSAAAPAPLPPAPIALGSRAIWFGLLLVVLVGAGWALLHYPNDGLATTPGQGIQEPGETEAPGGDTGDSKDPGEGGEEPGEPEPAEPDPVEPEPEPEPVKVELVSDDGEWVYEVTGGEPDQGLEVTLVAAGDCWIGPNLDGRTAADLTLHAGARRTWQADERLSMVLGNPPAVSVSVNGVDLGTPDTTQVLTLVFERK